VSDASALAVAILTGIGLIVALLTFRRSLASRARLDLSVGQELILHYASDSKLILTASFAIINKGSLPGLATELSAVICHRTQPCHSNLSSGEHLKCQSHFGMRPTGTRGGGPTRQDQCIR
jgi:hypothetical protein